MRMATLRSFPSQLTTFVGREVELSELARLLADPACRLLTLVGPGGIGKTRLAIEAAARRQDDFPDGVHFVSLTPLNSAENIVFAIAQSLDFHLNAQGDPEHQLIDYLREKTALLALDNFEHLLDGALLVAAILDAAPGVHITTTS